MNYAVIFTYSFDAETSVYLFKTAEEAKRFLTDSYTEELRIDTEENGWNSIGTFDETCDYASIITIFPSGDTDVTEMRVGTIYE